MFTVLAEKKNFLRLLLKDKSIAAVNTAALIAQN